MYLISKPFFCEVELGLLPSFFKGGLCLFHLRKIHLKDAQCFLKKLAFQYHKFIIVHEHLSLLEKFPHLRGVHLKSFQRHIFSKDDLRKMAQCFVSDGKTFSTSFHSIEEITQNTDIPFDYAFLSPIFDSVYKQNYSGKNFDITALPKPFPLIALGGITPENQMQAIQMGFDDIAVLGAVWQSKDPFQMFRKFS